MVVGAKLNGRRHVVVVVLRQPKHNHYNILTTLATILYKFPELGGRITTCSSQGGEGVIVCKGTSHSSNIITPYRFVVDSSQMTLRTLIRGL
jgi:hypothetical protein